MPTNTASSTGREHGRIVPPEAFPSSARPRLRGGFAAVVAGTLAWLLLFGITASAWADIAPSPRRPTREQEDEFLSTTIRLKIDAGTRVATLNIPKEMVAKLAGTKHRRGAAVDFSGRTILAGLVMSAALVSLVFVLRRQSARRRQWKIATASLVALAATLGALDLAWADIALPAKQPAADPLLEVVAVSNAKEVTLLIPPDMLRDLKRLVAEAEEAQSGDDGGDVVAPAKNAKPPKAPAPNAPAAPAPPAATPAAPK